MYKYESNHMKMKALTEIQFTFVAALIMILIIVGILMYISK